MAKHGIVADPDDLNRMGAAFLEAWASVELRTVRPGRRDRAHREWLAKLVLGLRAAGHIDDLAKVATIQFLATSPAAIP